MKRLLLLFFFSGSLDSFSQSTPEDTLTLAEFRKIDTANRPINVPYTWNVRTMEMKDIDRWYYTGWIKADTLRAVCLITLGHRQLGIAHARMGFVVIQPWQPVIYLDCDKRPLKKPAKGWAYEVVNEKIK